MDDRTAVNYKSHHQHQHYDLCGFGGSLAKPCCYGNRSQADGKLSEDHLKEGAVLSNGSFNMVQA